MGEEILHPDGQPAGAAQQGERGERNHVSHAGFTFWPSLVKREGGFFRLPFILFTSLVKQGEMGAILRMGGMTCTVIIQLAQKLVVWMR